MDEIDEGNGSGEKREGNSAEGFERHGLFGHEKKDTSEKQRVFAQAIPEGFSLGIAKGKGDCFFDACAEAINELLKEELYTLKQLRTLCDSHAKELLTRCGGAGTAEKHADNWIAKLFNGKWDEYNQYLLKIGFTAEELEHDDVFENNKYAVWGDQNINARIIAKELGVKIHIVELHENPDEETSKNQKFIVSHNLVDANEFTSLGPDAPSFDDKTIHIAVCDNHFVPILKKTTIQKRPISPPEILQPTIININNDNNKANDLESVIFSGENKVPPPSAEPPKKAVQTTNLAMAETVEKNLTPIVVRKNLEDFFLEQSTGIKEGGAETSKNIKRFFELSDHFLVPTSGQPLMSAEEALINGHQKKETLEKKRLQMKQYELMVSEVEKFRKEYEAQLKTGTVEQKKEDPQKLCDLLRKKVEAYYSVENMLPTYGDSLKQSVLSGDYGSRIPQGKGHYVLAQDELSQQSVLLSGNNPADFLRERDTRFCTPDESWYHVDTTGGTRRCEIAISLNSYWPASYLKAPDKSTKHLEQDIFNYLRRFNYLTDADGQSLSGKFDETVRQLFNDPALNDVLTILEEGNGSVIDSPLSKKIHETKERYTSYGESLPERLMMLIAKTDNKLTDWLNNHAAEIGLFKKGDAQHFIFSLLKYPTQELYKVINVIIHYCHNQINDQVLPFFSLLHRMEKIRGLDDEVLIAELNGLLADEGCIKALEKYTVANGFRGKDSAKKYVKHLIELKSNGKNISSKLEGVFKYCEQRGRQLCSEGFVCRNYIAHYQDNPRLWLSSETLFIHKAFKEEAKLSSDALQWYRETEIPIEEIKEEFRLLLSGTALRPVSDFSKDDLQRAARFVEDPQYAKGNEEHFELLKLYALVKGMCLDEYSIIDIYTPLKQKGKQSTSIGSLKRTSRHVANGKGSVCIIFRDKAYKLLSSQTDQSDTFLKVFFTEIVDQIKNSMKYFLRLKKDDIENKNFNYHSAVIERLGNLIKRCRERFEACKLVVSECEADYLQSSTDYDEIKKRAENKVATQKGSSDDNAIVTLRNQLLDPLIENMGLPVSDESRDIVRCRLEEMRYEAESCVALDDIKDSNGNTLFFLALQLDSPDELIDGLSRRFPNYFIPNNERKTPLLFLQQVAMNHRGKASGLPEVDRARKRFEQGLNSVVRHLFSLLESLVGELSTLKKLDGLTRLFLESLQTYIDVYMQDVKTDPRRFFDKVPAQGKKIVDLLTVLWEGGLDARDYAKIMEKVGAIVKVLGSSLFLDELDRNTVQFYELCGGVTRTDKYHSDIQNYRGRKRRLAESGSGYGQVRPREITDLKTGSVAQTEKITMLEQRIADVVADKHSLGKTVSEQQVIINAQKEELAAQKIILGELLSDKRERAIRKEEKRLAREAEQRAAHERSYTATVKGVAGSLFKGMFGEAVAPVSSLPPPLDESSERETGVLSRVFGAFLN